MNAVSENKPIEPRRLLFLLVIITAVAAYLNIFSNPFIFDDHLMITGVLPSKLNSHLFQSMRFLVDASFKLNYLMAGLNVADYHATNVFIHILNGLLIFGIVRRAMQLPSMNECRRRSSHAIALVSACIWVAHPLTTQGVTYTCERYESMMTMFLFMSLYFFTRAVGEGRGGGAWYVLSVAACAFGMGAKEVMIVTPVLILLFDFLFVGRSLKECFTRRYGYYIALAGTLLLAFVLAQQQQRYRPHEYYVWPGISPWTYLLTQCEVIPYYVKLVFWPGGLCVDYAWPPVEALADVWLRGVFILAVLAAVCVMVWRKKPAAFPLAFFFIVLAPSSSFIPRPDYAFDHRMYAPAAGLIVPAVMVGHAALQRYMRGLFMCALAAAVICCFAVLTRLRNEDYRSERTMWEDVVKKRPDNFRAYLPLISILLEEGNASGAGEVAQRTTARMRETAQRKDIRPSLAVNAAHWLPAMENQLGRVFLVQRKTREAIELFRSAIREQPDKVISHYNLALALYLDGSKDEADEVVNSAIAMNPSYPSPRLLKGAILTERGKFSEAIDQYETVLKSDPASIAAKCELAWLLATCPDAALRDGARAITLATSVWKATGYLSIHALDVLAAAYAETGEFEKAAKTAAQALERLKTAAVARERSQMIELGIPVPTGAGEIEFRCRMYESKKAFRIGP